VKAANVNARKTTHKVETSTSVRATISFPSDRYASLEEIAKQKKVSLAWVVRDAVDNYIESRWPLLIKKG